MSAESRHAARLGASPRARGPRWGPWLIGPACLAAVVASAVLVQLGPTELFAVVMGLLLALVFLWLGISVFSAAKADRKCPACGEDALERLDENTTRGLRCSACEWRDETASSFYLAEEEGPIEPMVLAQRRTRDSRGTPASSR